MNNLISAQEAFVAAQNGKAVLCRYAGNGTLHADKDFSALDQLPATVFFQPHYEFCIKIETMELSGITFAKPLTPHDVAEDQEIFIVMPACVLRTKYDAEHSDIQNSVMNGFAQADAENALLQLKAIGASFGCAIDNIEIKDGFNDSPKKRRNRKSKESVEAKKPIDQAANDDTSIDDIIGPISVQTPTPNDSEDAATEQKPDPFAAAKAAALNEANQSSHSDYESLLADLVERAKSANSPAEANALVRYARNWTVDQLKPLHAAISKRLTEFTQPATPEPPSLMVQIQNAPDLTALDALEIDVFARHPDIQPRLMGYVKKRRFELEQLASTSSIDGELP